MRACTDHLLRSPDLTTENFHQWLQFALQKRIMCWQVPTVWVELARGYGRMACEAAPALLRHVQSICDRLHKQPHWSDQDVQWHHIFQQTSTVHGAPIHCWGWMRWRVSFVCVLDRYTGGGNFVIVHITPVMRCPIKADFKACTCGRGVWHCRAKSGLEFFEKIERSQMWGVWNVHMPSWMYGCDITLICPPLDSETTQNSS